MYKIHPGIANVLQYILNCAIKTHPIINKQETNVSRKVNYLYLYLLTVKRI